MLAKSFVVNENQCPLEEWSDPARGSVKWRTLLSGDRTPSVSLVMGVAEMSERDDASISLHRHAETEAYYILSGKGVINLDGVEHLLSPGDAVFIASGVLHGARCLGAQPLRILYAFSADSFPEIVYDFPNAGQNSLPG